MEIKTPSVLLFPILQGELVYNLILEEGKL